MESSVASGSDRPGASEATIVTGKLTAVDERLKKTRRVQYSLFLQVIEIESGRVRFQFESARTKALKG